MKIAFFERFSENHVNGVRVCAYITATELVRLGHTVFFYDLSDKEESYVDENGIFIRVFPKKRFLLSTVLSGFLAQNPDQIDIFHFHSVFTLSHYLLSQKLKELGHLYIITPHGGYNINIFKKNYLLKALYFQLLERKHLHNANGVQCIGGEREIEDIARLNYKGPIKAVWNPVRVRPMSKPKELAVKRILYLGRYDIQHKGLSKLLHLFEKIEKMDSSIRLELYGKGPDKEKLLQLAKKLQLKNIKINEPIYGDEKQAVLKESSIYIQASKWEAFGASIAEALAIGIPVVVTKGCYLANLIAANKIGIVLDDDINAAAQQVVQLLSDEKQRRAMGTQARKVTIQEFDPQVVTTHLLDFYHQILQTRTSLATG